MTSNFLGQKTRDEEESYSIGTCTDRNNRPTSILTSVDILLLLEEVEFSFSAREIITEIRLETMSLIIVIDIESLYLTLANEK